MKQEIILSNSQCLYRVMAEDIVYIEADGNYSHLVLTGGEDVVLTVQIGKLAELIEAQLCSSVSPLAKMGRSLIINMNCIYYINPQKQQIVLRDCHGHTTRVLSAPTTVLRGLKEILDKRLLSRLATHGVQGSEAKTDNNHSMQE